MLDYDTYSDKVGTKYTVAWGELVEDAEGEFEVSTTPGVNRIVLAKMQRVAMLSADPALWIGRNWKLKTSDCAALCAEYIDAMHGSNYTGLMKGYSLKKWGEYFHRGMVAWLEDFGMPQVALEDRQPNDVVVYDYDGDHNMHIGIFLGEGKLLHHLPNKLSSIDVVDFTETDKFLGVFRHAD
mgnify:CR=1 FL=1